MNTGTFKTDEYVLEVTRPDTLEGTTLRRFSNDGHRGDQIGRVVKEYRRALADPDVSRVGLYRQMTKVTRIEVAVE